MKHKKGLLLLCTFFATLGFSTITAFAGGKKDSQNGATNVPTGSAEEIIGTKPYYGEGGGRGGGTPSNDTIHAKTLLGTAKVSGTKKKPVAFLSISESASEKTSQTLQLDFSTMDTEPKAKKILALDGKTLTVSGWQENGIFYVLDYTEF